MTRTGSGRVLAAIITGLALSPIATARGAGWEEHYEAGLRAMKASDLERAAGLMKQAVAEAEKLGAETPPAARSLAGLADVYLAQERTTEAGLLLERSLYILAKSTQANPSDLAHVYDSLSRVRVAQQKYPEAESLLKQVLAYREKTLGPDDPGVADILDRQASLGFFLKKGLDSVPLQRRALEIRVKAGEKSPPKLVQALLAQAQFEYWNDNKAGAETLRKRALAVQEKSLGADHPDVATTLMTIASARMEMHENGRFAMSVPDHNNVPSSEELLARMRPVFRENEPLVKRALLIREKALGAEHPDTVQAVQYLAAGYALVDDKARAEPYLRRTLTAREKTLGPEHPDLLDTIVVLARACMEQRKYREAIPLWRRAVAIEKAKKSSRPGDYPPLLELPPPPLSYQMGDDEELKDKPDDYAAQLRKAIRLADLMDDHASVATEADLAYLKRLGSVPAGTSLEGLRELLTIELPGDRIDDDGLAHLRGLFNLKSLSVTKHGTRTKSNVTDAGLVHLRRLTALVHLDLKVTSVRGSGLAHLKGMTELRKLDLMFTLVDDDGLAHLPVLPKLQTLNLSGTKVTDASVPTLKRLTGLETLLLIGTKVSGAAVGELVQAIPGLRVGGNNIRF